MSGDRPPIIRADDPSAIGEAVAALWAGGIVGIPTETVYGLAVLPQAEPLAHLLRAKRRPAEKGIAVLVDTLAQVEAVAIVPAAARRLAERFWPGALTLVLPPREGVELADPLYGQSGMLGFRLPDHAIPRRLAGELGPIAVTSANVSGEPDAREADELVDRIGESLALVLDGGRVRGGIPSTVVAVEAAPDGPGVPLILRQGAIDPAEILAALA